MKGSAIYCPLRHREHVLAGILGHAEPLRCLHEVTKHLTGLSRSLDPDCARLCPTLNRYIVSDPVLVTAVTRKRDVLAVIPDREEQEIVTFKARRKLVEPILGGDFLK
jgi:hypothetical protein